MENAGCEKFQTRKMLDMGKNYDAGEYYFRKNWTQRINRKKSLRYVKFQMREILINKNDLHMQKQIK